MGCVVWAWLTEAVDLGLTASVDSLTEAIIFMQPPQLISINRSGLVTLTASAKVLIEVVVISCLPPLKY